MAERNAGRELDVMVAERVMGWGWVGRLNTKWFAPLSTIGTDAEEEWATIRAARDTDVAEDPWWLAAEKKFGDCDVVPHYSTDLVSAWLVVEELRRRGFDVSVGVDAATDMKYNYSCEVARRQWRGSEYEEGETPAHAICKAALAVAGPGGVPAGDASDPEETTDG